MSSVSIALPGLSPVDSGIFAQDDVGGLEVESASGEFVAATPMPGAVVFNVGDLLMRWSNGTYRSGAEVALSKLITV